MTDLIKEENKSEVTDYLTISIADQMFGIPVLDVQEVSTSKEVDGVPLSSQEVCGILNLRGRVVTVISVRECLRLEPYENQQEQMSIVVDHKDELYSLVFDEVGDVMSLSMDEYESNPATLDKKWRDISDGIYRLDGMLLVVLDVFKLLNNVKS